MLELDNFLHFDEQGILLITQEILCDIQNLVIFHLIMYSRFIHILMVISYIVQLFLSHLGLVDLTLQWISLHQIFACNFLVDIILTLVRSNSLCIHLIAQV